MALNRRLLFGSLGVALVVGVTGGYALNRASGDGDRADDGVSLDIPGVVQDQSIPTNAPVRGDPFPATTLRDGDGNEVSSATLLGRPLVVNFWYSTCVPCRAELPAFAEVHGRLGDEVRFVGVNPRDGASGGEDFAHRLGVRYELLRDPDGALLSEVGLSIFPTTLFVDASGVIVEQHAGAMTAATLEEIIRTELLG